jgi:predicted nucleic acid-binding protein
VGCHCRLLAAGEATRRLCPSSASGHRHEVVDGWLALDVVRLVREKDDHWQVLRPLLSEAGTAGNLVTDAHLAALAISHGATLVSCDSDFARFQGLRWHNPLGPA